MNTKEYTSLEQAKHLFGIGINPESADMWYGELATGIIIPIVGDYAFEMRCREAKYYLKQSYKMVSPCWSLSALLELMPYDYILHKYNGKFFIVHDYSYCTSNHFTPVDAAVEMVEMLKRAKIIIQ